jgi:hypothetical protein
MQSRADKELIQEFATAVVEQDRCIAEGDARSGNRHANRYIAAATELLHRGDQSIDEFATLLSHDKPGVRVMAAAFLLESRTELAVATLRPIAAGRGLPALGAQMTLERYERGDLKLK